MLERKKVPIEQIRQFGLFQGLTDPILDEIRDNALLKTLSPGEILFRQGEHARRSYFCISGQLKLFRLTHAGSEKIFGIVSSCHDLPESISLGSRRRYPMSCAAIKESEIFSLDPDLIGEIFHRCPEMRTRLLESFETSFDKLVDHAELLSVDKASFRVASFLLNEYKRLGNPSSFSLSSSKKYVAGYLSLQPETLSRCLRHLRQNGIASSINREIEIHDPNGLENIVHCMDSAP